MSYSFAKGASAVACGEELISYGFVGKIKIISEDEYSPYDRTLISKRFEMIPYSKLLEAKNVEFFAATSLISLAKNKNEIRVKKIKNYKSRHLQCGPLKSWELATISYDKLVIATGLKSRIIHPGGILFIPLATSRLLITTTNTL